jgi:hypothetical protein
LNHRWDDPFLLEALAAEDRTALGRLEGHSGFRAAIRTGSAGLGAYGCSTRGALGLALLASFGIVLKLFVVEKQLLASGEYKLIPAIHTFQNLIDEFHRAFSSRSCQRCRS